jgi:tetratricopeptide (TPR) repeat protein
MKASRRTTIAVSILLVATMIGSVLLLRRVDRMRKSATLEDVLYLSSPKVLKRLSLGYDGLLADIYWTRVVQYYGRSLDLDDPKYQLLAPLLDITTTLDPHLTVAYQFGANFLAAKPPLGAGQPEKAVQLAEYGVRNNPDDWRLYYELGFIHYRNKDYARAADAFWRGSQVPNSHHWLKLMAALMAGRAGDVQTARMMWTTTYQSTQDKSIHANAAAHLRALQVDEDVRALEKLVAQYRDQTGHLPANFSDLQLAGVPVDPLGHPYKLKSDGSVEVADAEYLPFIEEGIPAGYVPPKVPKFLPAD